MTEATETQGGRLLLVDDEPQNLAVLSAILQPHYHVRAVTSGQRALQAVAAQRPDLVLLDVMMPGMDGFELLARLRADPATAEVPVIFVTAAVAEADEERGFAAGASDYIHKPIVAPLVLARVKAQLEAKAARDLLRQTNAKLHSRVAEGAQALEQAQRLLLQSEKLSAMGMLAAGVAHEINNPITFVDANLTTLAEYVAQLSQVLAAYASVEPQLPPEQRATLEAAKAAAQLEYVMSDLPTLASESREGIARIRTIVRDLKDFSRSDDTDWRYANLAAVLDSTLNIAKNEYRYHCTLHKHYAELPDIWCLPSRLGQVFLNLVMNAAQAIEGKGDLTVSTARVDERTVSVAVTDTGKGIAPDVLPRLFEPFFTTKPPGKGTGLGLPTVQQIVERHGGHVDVASELGRGTTFTVTLPIGPRT